MKEKLRKYWPTLLAISIALAIFLPSIVWAQVVPAAGSDESTELGWIGNSVIKAVSAIVQILISLFGKLTVQLIHILILVAGYNGYMDSTVISVGWVIVRDVANLFIVALILIVSIGSIVNPERFGGAKQVFRILLYALFINFSKTICGLFIDISQLVMLTFVNGFAQAAGGNFTEALGITKITDITPGTTALSFSAAMVGLFLGLLMFIIITVIIAVMTVALVVRMVTLWLLVVISPLAFALGASDMTKPHYADWWKRFSAELTTGPIVAFFLWLSLISFQSSDGSNLTGQKLQDLPAGAKEPVTISSCESVACNEENMIRFIVATVMLLAGLGFAKDFSGLGGDLAKSAGVLGKKYATGAGRWMAKKAALPVAAVATGGVAGAAVYGGVALASRSQRVRDLTGKGMARMPGLRTAGLRIQANVAKERMESLKKSEETAKYGTWEQMKKRTYTYDKVTGRVSEDLTVDRDTALANYKLLMKDKDWLAESSDAEKQFVMSQATKYAKEIKDKESLDLVTDVEKSNPNLIPADKKASDPIYNTQPETMNDPHFFETMDNISASDVLKMDARAFTAKVVARLPEGAIEKIFKDGNAAQQKTLGEILRKFADKKDASINPADRNAYYEKVENNKRKVDTLSTHELSQTDMVAEVMRKPLTSDREDLFKNKEKKKTIGETAVAGLTTARGEAGFAYDDQNARLAEAAAVAEENIGNAYQYDQVAGKFQGKQDRDAFESALRGKSKIDVAFAVDVAQITDTTEAGQSLAAKLTSNDIADLAKKAEGNSVKGDKVRAIVATLQKMANDAKYAAIQAELNKKLVQLGKSPITNQYI